MVAVVVMAVAEEDTVVGDLVEAMQVDLVAADFMAEALEVIPLDSLVTQLWWYYGGGWYGGGHYYGGAWLLPVQRICTIPTTLTGIGLRSVILMAGATESGSRTIIEGEGYFLQSLLRPS